MLITSDITNETAICEAVRNLKIITGYISINSYPGKNLACFERLQIVAGKTFIKHIKYEKRSVTAIQIRQTKNHAAGKHNIEALGTCFN